MAKRTIVFIDASYNASTGDVGIGIYEQNTNTAEMLYTKVNGTSATSMEQLGFEIAKHLYKGKKNVVVFTDNENVATKNSSPKLKVCWVPREVNEIADKLANLAVKKKESTIDLDIEIFLQKTNHSDGVILDPLAYIRSYPKSKKVALLKKLATVSKEHELIELLQKNVDTPIKDTNRMKLSFRQLVNILFTKNELPTKTRVSLGKEATKGMTKKQAIKILQGIK